jgi:hypothetical protein
MAFSQGGNPDTATQNLSFPRVPRLYALLRCRYAFVPTASGIQTVEIPNPLPHAFLASEYRVAETRDAIFAALNAPNFDPQRTVLLEREPSPRPAASPAMGQVRVTRSAPDGLTIETEVAAPTLLVITDLYSAGWKARALEGSSQQDYEVMPADYVLRAVPLAAGKHRLQLEYRPATLTAGFALSGGAWLAWIGGTILVCRRPRQAAHSP